MKSQTGIGRKSGRRLLFLILCIAGSITCGDEGSGFFPGAEDFRFGALLMRALDQQGSPVAGVTMELRDQRGTLHWGEFNVTGTEGSVGFSALLPGRYTVTIQPPAGYVVPASQSNPLAVEVRNAQTIDIAVALRRL